MLVLVGDGRREGTQRVALGDAQPVRTQPRAHRRRHAQRKHKVPDHDCALLNHKRLQQLRLRWRRRSYVRRRVPGCAARCGGGG